MAGAGRGGREALGGLEARLDGLARPAWTERFGDPLDRFDDALARFAPPVDWGEVEAGLSDTARRSGRSSARRVEGARGTEGSPAFVPVGRESEQRSWPLGSTYRVVTVTTDELGLLLQVGPHGPHGPVGPHGLMGPGGGGIWGAMPWGVGGAVPGYSRRSSGCSSSWRSSRAWRTSSDGSSSATPARPTRAVLEARYARGGIGDEEFERRRDRLTVEP